MHSTAKASRTFLVSVGLTILAGPGWRRARRDRLCALSRGRGLDSRRVLVEACEVLAGFPGGREARRPRVDGKHRQEVTQQIGAARTAVDRNTRCSYDPRQTSAAPEPDSGNPTVRDRRGASGNVASRSSVSVRARVRLLSRQPHGRIEAAAGGNRHQSAMPPVPAPPADPTALLLSVEPFGGGWGGENFRFLLWSRATV